MKRVILYCYFMAGVAVSNAQQLLPTKNLARLSGVVTNFKGKVLANEIILFSNTKTNELHKAVTDDKGAFELLIPVGASYGLKYKTFTTDVNYTEMIVPADSGASYQVKIKIEPPKSYVLENVYFDSGRSTLKPQSDKGLNDLVEVLKLKRNMSVEIQGHTDNVGDDNANLKLSQERAEAVKRFLVKKGIEEKRIVAKGYGPGMPIADNGDEAGRSKNRRTSLKVIKD